MGPEYVVPQLESPLKATSSTRFLPILTALILGGLSCLSLLSYLRARQVMDRQITEGTLPLTSDTIVYRLEQTLRKPILASGLMGGNTFLEETLIHGEQNSSQIQEYLARIQQKTGAITTFLVSDRSRRYYHPTGILKRVSSQDPQDRWYYRFRSSGKPIEINIDRDTADLQRVTAFINVPVISRDRRFLGATGLGLDMRALQTQLQQVQRQYGARVLLVDPGGRILLASDGSSGTLARLEGFGPQAARTLLQAGSTQTLPLGNGQLYVRSNRLSDIGWTLVVIQSRSSEQRAFIDLLAQNLAIAVLLSLVLVYLAHLTLGREQRQLELLARTDTLSGLLNRSAFPALFQQLSGQGMDPQQPLAIALMDIDHFKAINDRYGHPVGDEVIRHVSRCLQVSVRNGDPLFRWGGEEFLLMLPGCSLEQAVERLEGIRRELLSQPFIVPASQGSGPTVPVTLSFGVTVMASGETSSRVLQRADEALYTAKKAGRDHIASREAPAQSARADSPRAVSPDGADPSRTPPIR